MVLQPAVINTLIIYRVILSDDVKTIFFLYVFNQFSQNINYYVTEKNVYIVAI